MKRLSIFLLSAALVAALRAQQPIAALDTPVPQNFDSMAGTTAALPVGWRVGNGRDAIDWSNGLGATTDSGGTTGSGSISGGGCYNFADGINASATDRALGFLGAEGTLGIGVYRTPRSILYAFRNDTGRIISAIDLAWNYEKYRNGTRTNQWTFFHGSSSSPSTAATSGDQSYASDGNTSLVNPPSSIPKSIRISGLNIAPGATYYLRWTYTGISGDTFSHALGIDDFSISGNKPVLLNHVAFKPFKTNIGNASAAQSFTADGRDLVDGATASVAPGFEISKNGTTWASSVTLERTANGTLGAVGLQVRLAAPSQSGSMDGNLTITSNGADTQTIPLSGTVLGVMSSSAAALTGFSASVNSASDGQFFTLNGAGVKEPVTLTAPAGYELSVDGSQFSRQVTLGSSPRIQSIFREDMGTSRGAFIEVGSGTEFPNLEAFAAITSTGSVITWGSSTGGGDSSAVSASLSSGVIEIYSNWRAFAALKNDGSVVTWGQNTFGGNMFGLAGFSATVASQLTSGVVSISSSASAFAALKADGSVVTWGDSGGDSSAVAQLLGSGVVSISSNKYAFAALKEDGSVVTWGPNIYGGNSSAVASSLQSGVVAIHSTDSAFAALKSDSSVVTWGDSTMGGDSSAVADKLLSGVASIHSSQGAFAALKADGSVVTWGAELHGGSSTIWSYNRNPNPSVASQLASNVKAVYPSNGAFAALKSNGSVVTWGYDYGGGDSSAVAAKLSSGVVDIYTNRNCFAALKEDGSVVTWGVPPNGGDSSSVASQLAEGVSAIFSSDAAFAAVTTSGAVVTWGSAENGGDSSAVASNLSSGVVSIVGHRLAFSALKNDGSIVSWGYPEFGGSGTTANIGTFALPVLPAVIHARMISGSSAGPRSGNLTITSPGVLTQTISLSGTVLGELSTSVAALTGFSTSSGAASGAQSFTLNGLEVTSPVLVTAPDGYEVSSDGLTFGNSILLKGASGTVASVDRDGSLEGRGHIWSRGSGTEFPNFYAFAAIRPGGSVVAWGDPAYGGDASGVASSLQGGVMEIYMNTHGFAAVKHDGSVVTWGNPANGGDSSSVEGQLASGVVEVSSTQRAFAALKQNGSVVFWGAIGNNNTGSYLIPFSQVASELQSGVVKIYSAADAFAALKSNGSVVTWGAGHDGGDSSRVAGSLGSGVVEIVPVRGGFAARKDDGSVVSWGAFSTSLSFSPSTGAQVIEESAAVPEELAPLLSSGVVKVTSNAYRFAALKSNGAVVTWGSPTFSPDPSPSVRTALESGVVAVYGNRAAMAALKQDGSVVTWGIPSAGGDSSAVAQELSEGVVDVFSNPECFAALKDDGSVVTWGFVNAGGLSQKATPSTQNFMTYDYVSVADDLSSGVVRIQSTAGAFAATKSDGSVVVWGDSQYGGDEREAAAELAAGVGSVHANGLAFVATKTDGSLVAWGNANSAPAQLAGPPALPATVYVRMAAGSSAGPVTGNIAISSPGFSDRSVSLSGAVGSGPPTAPYEAWVALWVAQNPLFTGAAALENADPDGDGIANLMEYALGLNPGTSGVIPAALVMNGTQLEYSYTRSSTAREDGLIYQVEWSDTLEPGSWNTENVTQQIISTDDALETVKAYIPAGSSGKRFLRLRVNPADN